MKNKLIALLLLTAVAFTLPVACTEASPSEQTGNGSLAVQPTKNFSEKITVILPEIEMDNIGFYEAETRRFEQLTGIQVERIYGSWDDIAEFILLDLEKSGGSYDVIEFDNSWIASFHRNNWLEPLDRYVSEEIKNGMLPGLIDKFSIDGKLYGITWNNDTRFFMYNQNLLTKAGYDAPPQTWGELTEMSKKIINDGIAPFGYSESYIQQQSGSNEIAFLVYSFGGRLFDDNCKPVLAEDPKTKAAFEFLNQAINVDKICDPAALMSDYQSVSNMFCMGQTAFVLQAWAGVYEMANNKEFSIIPGHIAVGNASIHAEGEAPIVLTLPEAMAIPKTSKNKDAAWKYIEYMSSIEVDKRRCEAIGSLPLWSSLFTDPELLALFPYWENFGYQSKYAVGLPDLLWYEEYSEILMRETHKMLNGEITVDECLQAIQSQCEALAASKP